MTPVEVTEWLTWRTLDPSDQGLVDIVALAGRDGFQVVCHLRREDGTWDALVRREVALSPDEWLARARASWLARDRAAMSCPCASHAAVLEEARAEFGAALHAALVGGLDVLQLRHLPPAPERWR